MVTITFVGQSDFFGVHLSVKEGFDGFDDEFGELLFHSALGYWAQ